MKARNNTLDILKFLTCPFILLIHCPLPGVESLILLRFGRFGVPFFLMLSGWFSFPDSPDTMIAHARKKLLDTIKLLGAFAVAYGILNSLTAALGGDPFWSWVREYCTWETLKEFLLYNRALFFGSTGYYPFMLIYVYVIFIILTGYGWLNKCFFLIPVLLACNVHLLLLKEYPWYHYGNYCLTGLPFFLLGHWLHRNQHKLPDNGALWAGLFGLSTALIVCDAFWIQKDVCSFLGCILVAVSLLMFAVNCRYNAKNQALVKALQRYSVYIFVLHCGVRDVLRGIQGRYQIACSEYVFVGGVVLVSLLISVVWDQVSLGIIARRKQRIHG